MKKDWGAVAIGGLLLSMTAVGYAAGSDAIGAVDTAFKFLGKDDQIVVDAYDDPKVKGVTCYVSRAKKGGALGTMGLATDTSDASIACRQVADTLQFADKLPMQEDVFTERSSILFKKLHIVRMVDPARNTLVYLTYSDKLVDGSPKNSVTAVPVPRANVIPVKAK